MGILTEIKPTVTTNIETMTSTQLSELLGYEKKEVNRKIKAMFSDKIDGGIISPSLDSRGYVEEYYVPELESKMFVAKHDINYLEKITQYWIDRNKPQVLTPIEMIANMALGMVQQEKELKAVQATQLHQEERIAQIEAKTSLVGSLMKGYVGRKEAHLFYCKGISYDTFRTFAQLHGMPSEPYKYLQDGGQVFESVQYKITDVQKLYAHILAGAVRISKHYYTHADFTGKFKITL